MALKSMLSAKKKAKALFITQKTFCKKESLSVLVETTLLTCLKLKIHFLRNDFTIFAVLPLATTKAFLTIISSKYVIRRQVSKITIQDLFFEEFLKFYQSFLNELLYLLAMPKKAKYWNLL